MLRVRATRLHIVVEEHNYSVEHHVAHPNDRNQQTIANIIIYICALISVFTSFHECPNVFSFVLPVLIR